MQGPASLCRLLRLDACWSHVMEPSRVEEQMLRYGNLTRTNVC